MYTAYIVRINELRKHSNADRLQVANIFDCNVIVNMNTKVGDIGIFFPVDGQLSKAYCEQNNLCRKKDENGKNIGGYLDESKRCVRAMGLCYNNKANNKWNYFYIKENPLLFFT